jgi:hypothetical protein
MDQALAEYLFITTLATFVLLFQIYWRLTHPFHCTCGYQTFWARRMFAHLQTGHRYVEHQRET